LSPPYRPSQSSGNATVSQHISVGSYPGRYTEVVVDFLTVWRQMSVYYLDHAMVSSL
jgi:hypothetical protein